MTEDECCYRPDLAAARIAALTHALRYCGEAIDTGRSEPLFVARDLIRNTLEDDTALQRNGET